MSSVEAIVKFAEELITITTSKPLSFIQKVILQEALSKTQKTYAQIAQENCYSETYIKQWVAPRLWSQLSDALGEKVNKTNCYAVLEQRLSSPQALTSSTRLIDTSQTHLLERPEGQVPLTSPFYIEREPIESICYQEIRKPGALLRITSPRKFGKSSLVARITAQGQKQNYYIVRLSLYQAETEVFTSIRKFLRWVCANVTQQLGLGSKLDDYWDETIGALISCTMYFHSYILREIPNPIILALDGIDQIFEYPDIAPDFLALLRSWYEAAKDTEIWNKIRLILVQATDIYVPFKINQSPFNVGLFIELPPFNQSQIEDLAQRYGLQLTSSEFDQVIRLTGGFPYLVQMAFYCSKCHNITLEALLQDATTERGLFTKHLNYLFVKLQQDSRLLEGFQKVLNSPIELETEVRFKLKSLGLVKLEGNKAYISCTLYRDYFSTYLGQ